VRFPCPHGHKDAYGRPVVHASRRLCQIEAALQKENRAKLASSSAPTTPPGPGAAPPAAPATAPAPKPAAPRPSGAWGIDYAPATSTDSAATEARLAPAQMEWEITAETSERFWANIFAVIAMVCEWICKFFSDDTYKVPPIPEEVFRLDEGQKFVFRTALRSPTTVFLKKVMGAKSPEHADMIVAGMSGLIGFGQVFWKIGLHFWTHIPKSPRFQRMKARMGKGLRRRGSSDEEEESPVAERRPVRRVLNPEPEPADKTRSIVPPGAGVPA
jgi:hypothetical protein